MDEGDNQNGKPNLLMLERIGKIILDTCRQGLKVKYVSEMMNDLVNLNSSIMRSSLEDLSCANTSLQISKEQASFLKRHIFHFIELLKLYDDLGKEILHEKNGVLTFEEMYIILREAEEEGVPKDLVLEIFHTASIRCVSSIAPHTFNVSNLQTYGNSQEYTLESITNEVRQDDRMETKKCDDEFTHVDLVYSNSAESFNTLDIYGNNRTLCNLDEESTQINLTNSSLTESSHTFAEDDISESAETHTIDELLESKTFQRLREFARVPERVRNNTNARNADIKKHHDGISQQQRNDLIFSVSGEDEDDSLGKGFFVSESFKNEGDSYDGIWNVVPKPDEMQYIHLVEKLLTLDEAGVNKELAIFFNRTPGRNDDEERDGKNEAYHGEGEDSCTSSKFSEGMEEMLTHIEDDESLKEGITAFFTRSSLHASSCFDSFDSGEENKTSLTNNNFIEKRSPVSKALERTRPHKLSNDLNNNINEKQSHDTFFLDSSRVKKSTMESTAVPVWSKPSHDLKSRGYIHSPSSYLTRLFGSEFD